MNRKEFVLKIRNSVKDSTEKLLDAKKAYDELNKKKEEFSYEKKADASMKLMGMKHEAVKLLDQAQRNIDVLADVYKNVLYDADSLKPGDITDDIKLLNSSVKLEERDIDDILSRNEGNVTMTKLVLRYAKENKLKTDQQCYMIYSGINKQMSDVDYIADVSKRILNHYGHPDSYKIMYDRLLGEESGLDEWAKEGETA